MFNRFPLLWTFCCVDMYLHWRNLSSRPPALGTHEFIKLCKVRSSGMLVQLQPCLISENVCNTAGDLHGREVHHQSVFHHGWAGGQCADHTQQDDGVRENSTSVGLMLSSDMDVLPPRGALGYCFVEMSDEATAERCLRKINGKSLPGASPVCLCFFSQWEWLLERLRLVTFSSLPGSSWTGQPLGNRTLGESRRGEKRR